MSSLAVLAVLALAACDGGLNTVTDAGPADLIGNGDGDLGDGDGDGDEEVDGGACADGACSTDGGPVRGDGDGDGEADGGACADGACSTDGGPARGDGDGDPGDGDGDGDPGDGDGDGDGDPGDGDGDGDSSGPVRFVALGDTGEGNEDQYMVSAVMETVCADQGCDFAILLGDNFYDTGVTGTDDPQWQTKFEMPYVNHDFLFYPTLGNHDGGFQGSGIQVEPGNIQVEYTAMSDRWEMPARWYMHSHGNVDMISIDSSSVFFDGFPLLDHFETMTQEQAAWLQGLWSGGSTGDWRIVYGHHPYLSNGRHGNAGEYEGIPNIPYVSGDNIKDFVEGNICGSADLYICGHDHNRQWLAADCQGTQFIVAGAGAKTTEFEGDNPVNFQDDTLEGFLWFEIDGNELTLQFWNKNGVMEFEGGITK